MHTVASIRSAFFQPVILNKEKKMLTLSFLLQSACTIDFPNRNPEVFTTIPLPILTGMVLPSRRETVMISIPELGQEPTWYLDSDGDGYGDPSSTKDACERPEGYVDNDQDCNDSDASIFPGNAREEGDLCVVDADGDGYGAANPSVSADFGSDCDDSDPSVYPGRNKEQGFVCVLDSDGDGYGDLEPPLPYEPGTDCNDADELINPEAQEVCDEFDNDCDDNIDDNRM